MSKKRIILKDVAKRAGVSVPTVSRVINKEKYVSVDVKKRVLTAVKDLNYEPEWTARSLRLGKTNIVSIIIPNIANYFFSSVVLGVEQFFRSKGREIILFNTSNDEKVEEKAIRIAIAKRVEGIVLATISKNNNVIRDNIKSFGVPFVIVDNKIDVDNVDFVLHDDINGAFKLVDHLIKIHDYKKIACISGPLDESSGIDKLIGYKKALKENNIPINEEYIKIANWKKSEAYEATKELFNMKDKPEAIFTANTNMVIGCLRYVNSENIRVPDDVAVVTFDDYDYVSAFNPPLTTLEKVDTRMGEIAAELLYKRINGKGGKYREIRVDSGIVIRKSCDCNIDLKLENRNRKFW